MIGLTYSRGKEGRSTYFRPSNTILALHTIALFEFICYIFSLMEKILPILDEFRSTPEHVVTVGLLKQEI